MLTVSNKTESKNEHTTIANVRVNKGENYSLIEVILPLKTFFRVFSYID